MASNAHKESSSSYGKKIAIVTGTVAYEIKEALFRKLFAEVVVPNLDSTLPVKDIRDFVLRLLQKHIFTDEEILSFLTVIFSVEQYQKASREFFGPLSESPHRWLYSEIAPILDLRNLPKTFFYQYKYYCHEKAASSLAYYIEVSNTHLINMLRYILVSLINDTSEPFVFKDGDKIEEFGPSQRWFIHEFVRIFFRSMKSDTIKYNHRKSRTRKGRGATTPAGVQITTIPEKVSIDRELLICELTKQYVIWLSDNASMACGSGGGGSHNSPLAVVEIKEDDPSVLVALPVLNDVSGDASSENESKE